MIAEAKPLPEIDVALTELARRQTRALVSAALRTTGAGILIAVGVTRSPALAANRGLLDALAIALVIWPLLMDWGRLMAWRIALGKAYANADRWSEAARAMAPFSLAYARFFDARGEGRRLLAEAQTRIDRKRNNR